MPARIPIDREKIAAFCRKWRITELALFGSVLREDFRPDSDVDVLVTFAPECHWRLRDYLLMEDELRTIVGRPVDLLERPVVERSKNWIRRRAILDSLETLHVAG